LKKLDKHKPQVIGLDIYRDVPEGKGRADLVQYLQQSNHIIPLCVHPDGESPSVQPPTGISENRIGFIDVVRDPDGTLRRHLLALDPPNKVQCPAYYAFSSLLAIHYLKAKGYSLNFPSEDSWQLDQVGFKVLKAHTGFYQQRAMTRGHQLLLNYRSYNSLKDIAERVTLTKVLTNQVNPNQINSRIILIGVTDPRLAKDDFNTPYHQKIRGLLLHAQMVSQLVSAVEDQRLLLRFWPLWGDALWVWGWSLVGGLLTGRFGSLLPLTLAGGAVLISLWGISFIFLLEKGVLLPLVPSVLALVTSSGTVAANTKFQIQR
jgi:CHASE2 domain-containing sensor protein